MIQLAICASALLFASQPALPAPVQQVHSVRDGQLPGVASPMVPLCFPGFGGVISCPCGQPANPAGGCANFGAGSTSGAYLFATGIASLSTDNVTLESGNHRIPPPAGILNVFWSGSSSSMPGFSNGAGVRCVTGNLKRLYFGSTVAGVVYKPGPGEPPVSDMSFALGVPITAGETRYYFNSYRDAGATGPCGSTAITINTTNAGSIQWSF
jgi:hypothetical protein